MLKITIELLPFGSETNKKTLGIMRIGNDLTGTKTMGNYKYSFQYNTRKNYSGEIKKFPRQRLNAWDLLFRVLYHARGKENHAPVEGFEE